MKTCKLIDRRDNYIVAGPQGLYSSGDPTTRLSKFTGGTTAFNWHMVIFLKLNEHEMGLLMDSRDFSLVKSIV